MPDWRGVVRPVTEWAMLVCPLLVAGFGILYVLTGGVLAWLGWPLMALGCSAVAGVLWLGPVPERSPVVEQSLGEVAALMRARARYRLLHRYEESGSFLDS